MPSRRTLLSTVSAAAAGAVAGCITFFPDPGVDGYVQLKSIEAWKRDSEDGEPSKDVIVRVWPKRGPNPNPTETELMALDDEWADRFNTPLEPVVSDELHDDLVRTYDTVQYTVGVCSEEWADARGDDVKCHNAPVSREEFNTAQPYDHVRASYEDHELAIHSREGEWSFDSE